MSIKELTIGAPFFDLKVLQDEASYRITGKTIVLNLADDQVCVRQQRLGLLQSVILKDTFIEDVRHSVIIERFADYDNETALLSDIRSAWPSAYQLRKEERLRGVEHYMSPKVWDGQFGFTLYHSASVPLNVGLHRDHAFCPVPGFREVHTQIVGFGKMQQCREQDVETLYLEELMAPVLHTAPCMTLRGIIPGTSLKQSHPRFLWP